jgi:hypothetical protein
MALLHGSTRSLQRLHPLLSSFDADGDRVSQLQHPIQDMDGHGNLGGATPVLAEAQPIADHLFVTPDDGLDPAARVVARRLLPSHPPSFGDALEMAVALRGLGSLDWARRQEAKMWELRTSTSLGRLWQSQGKRRDAYALLAPVYLWFTEGFDAKDLQDAKALLAELG